MEKVCLLALSIFLFGQASASYSENFQLDNAQEKFNTDHVIITFNIEISWEKENPVVECGIVDMEDFICSGLALSVVDLVYKKTEEAFFELSDTEEGLEKMSASGIIRIGLNDVNVISEVKVTSDLSLQCMSYYNIEIETSGGNKCSDYPTKLGEMSCTESATDENRFWEVITGIHSLSEPTTEENETGNAELKKNWNITEMQENLIQFEASRKLMCKCHTENEVLLSRLGFRFVPATIGQIIRKCFQQHQINADFRPFLNTPFCYGEESILQDE